VFDPAVGVLSVVGSLDGCDRSGDRSVGSNTRASAFWVSFGLRHYGFNGGE
jgi:hypothetical protein